MTVSPRRSRATAHGPYQYQYRLLAVGCSTVHGWSTGFGMADQPVPDANAASTASNEATAAFKKWLDLVDPGPRATWFGMSDEQLSDAPAASTESNEAEAAFNKWLHRSLNRLDALVLSLFILYWALQMWLSGCHPSEMLVLLLIGSLLAFRTVDRRVETILTAGEALQPPTSCRILVSLTSNEAESDGVRWCICLLVAHAVEAGTIAVGRTARILSIAQPRLDHREFACAICMLIGLMHGVRPIPPRLKLCTAAAFELIFFLWLVPCMPLHHKGQQHPPHPARLPSGAVNADWITLVGGCAACFALGYVISWQMLAHVVRPLWETSVGQVERLTAEKQRLLYDLNMAEGRRTRAEGEVVRLQNIGGGDGESTSASGFTRVPFSAPSSTAGTNEELSGLTVQALLQHAGMTSFKGSPEPVPLYQCLPEYEGERHRQGVCYLTSPAMREPLCARVAFNANALCEQRGGGLYVPSGDSELKAGVLVDAKGVVLNPYGAALMEEEEAIYVVTADGDLILSFNIRPRASSYTSGDDGGMEAGYHGFHHHSSLVGGGAVAAAGTMRIRKGLVVAMDNASGHYRPPGSTLQVAMGRLEALGLSGLDHVEVIDVTASGATCHTPLVGISAAGTAHPMELTESHTGLVQRPMVHRARQSPAANGRA